MTQRKVVTLNTTTGRLEVPQVGDDYLLPDNTEIQGTLTVSGNINGRDTAADAVLLDAALQPSDLASQGDAEAGVDDSKWMSPLKVAQAIAQLTAGIKNNFNGLADPTGNDDTTQGYSIGSVWINLGTENAFRCVDATATAAKWIDTTLTAAELATVALSGNSDDLIEGTTKLLLTATERSAIDGLVKNNYVAVTDPSTTDDSGAGYDYGSIWINLNTPEVFFCTNPSAGIAVWASVMTGGAVEGTSILSTGETGGSKFLREDGDGTCSWVAIPGGGDALTSSPLSQFAATTSAQLAGVMSDETGTGALVFANSPTLVTPALGTPASGNLSNCTNIPAPEGTAVKSTGEAGGSKFLREDGDGTCSWQSIPGGGDALTSSPLSQFAATTSAQLAGVMSDETGTGALCFADSPVLVTPQLGTPASGNLSNCNGYKQVYAIACSDETTDLTTGTGKAEFQIVDGAFTLTAIYATVSTAPTGSTIIVDVNLNGTTLMTTNKISIDASEKTSDTAATAPGLTTTALTENGVITVDIDQVGSTTAGKGLKVYLVGYWT